MKRVIQGERTCRILYQPDAKVAFVIEDIIRRGFAEEHHVDGDQEPFFTNVSHGCHDAHRPFGNMRVLVHQH